MNTQGTRIAAKIPNALIGSILLPIHEAKAPADVNDVTNIA